MTIEAFPHLYDVPGISGSFDAVAVHPYAGKTKDHNIGNCRFCNTAGLFTVNGNPKPAWNALVGITGGAP